MSIPLSFLKGLPSPPPGTSLGDLLTELVTDSGKFNTLLDCLCSTTEAAIHLPNRLRPPLCLIEKWSGGVEGGLQRFRGPSWQVWYVYPVISL